MDRITLSLPADPSFHGALRLVVGGIGARSHLSVEQVSELQLAVETLIANTPVTGEVVSLQADVDGSAVSVELGPFLAAPDPSVLRVAERLAGSALVAEHDEARWVVLAPGGATP